MDWQDPSADAGGWIVWLMVIIGLVTGGFMMALIIWPPG